MTFDVPAGVSKRGSSVCSFVCWSVVCHCVQLASCVVADLPYSMNEQTRKHSCIKFGQLPTILTTEARWVMMMGDVF